MCGWYVLFQDLFVPFTISSVQELTLGANLPLSDLQRLQWKTEESNVVMDKGKELVYFGNSEHTIGSWTNK